MLEQMRIIFILAMIGTAVFAFYSYQGDAVVEVHEVVKDVAVTIQK